MRTIYIPKGESRSYDYLVTDNLVVDGYLNVVNGVKAKNVCGKGVVTSGTVSADVIRVAEIETTTIVCRRLMAERVAAAEVFASDCAAVSCFLSAAYVETGKLTAAISEIDEIKAEEVIHLRPEKRGMLLTLLLSALRSLWLRLLEPEEVMDAEYEKAEAQPENEMKASEQAQEEPEPPIGERVARVVRQVLEEEAKQEQERDSEDFELRRVVSLFKLLREEGYTLRIEPGTPEENAPVFKFEKEEALRPAA